MKILITLCEGPHDVAFLYRILLTEGFTNCQLKINEYPKPLDSFLTEQAKGENIEDRKLEEVRNRLLPSEVLIRDNKELILFYAIGGDGKKEQRKTLVEKIRSFASITDPKAFNPTDTNYKYSIFYLFDADDKGIEARLKEINAELKETISVLDQSIDANGAKISFENIDYGAYIFARPDESIGKLEDILLPLMRKENDAIFDSADNYLKAHGNPDRIYRLTIKRDANGSLSEQRKTKKESKFDSQKSAIGIAGQLQNSGATNTVCIKFSDYLNLKKIKEDRSCQDIVAAFNRLL